MNLADAVLCIDCEWIYSSLESPQQCPRCQSRVGFPLARKMNDARHSVTHLSRPMGIVQISNSARKPATIAESVSPSGRDSCSKPIFGATSQRFTRKDRK